MDRCSAELDIPKVCLTLSFRAPHRLKIVVAHCLDKEASRNAQLRLCCLARAFMSVHEHTSL